jgi:hypothetical protein
MPPPFFSICLYTSAVFGKNLIPFTKKMGERWVQTGGGWGKMEENGKNNPELTGGWRDDKKK